MATTSSNAYRIRFISLDVGDSRIFNQCGTFFKIPVETNLVFSAIPLLSDYPFSKQGNYQTSLHVDVCSIITHHLDRLISF